jgi:hypothetical protein
MSVIIVEAVKDGIFTKTLRKAAERKVASELLRVAKRAKHSKPKFSVSWHTSSGQKALASPTTLVVYVVRRSAGAQAFKLVQRHLAVPAKQETEIRKRLGKSMQHEGGYNFKFGSSRKSVSFAGVDGFEKLLREVGSSDTGKFVAFTHAHALKVQRDLGTQLAWVILHELGHAMDASHGKGLMSPSSAVASQVGADQHFTLTSQQEIDSWLWAVANGW